MRARWPLYPPPFPTETLERYVRRLANLYEDSFPNFCWHALGIPYTDQDGLRLADPSEEVLGYLSDGVGMTVAALREHCPARLVQAAFIEFEAWQKTPEGKAEIEHFYSTLAPEWAVRDSA